jgi:hypothetical protein|tara:strand:- start:1697 stop:1888 length:192 start_codon:yes stop_codon:yes gene_type:complete
MSVPDNSTLPSHGDKKVFATDLPQAGKACERQWQFHAGYSGHLICGKNTPKGSVSFRKQGLSH